MDTKSAAKQEFLPLLRALVRAYQAFALYDAAGYRDTGLTPPQADVIFTLGNTDGLTCKEIGELTLITKGTLTGVIDRLQKKKLVTRFACPEDRRCIRVALTDKGRELFEREFPRQIEYLKRRFDRLSASDRQDAIVSLQKLSTLF